MNPDQPHTRTLQAGTNDQAFDALLEQIRGLVQSARKTAATAINSLQVSTRFEIGRCDCRTRAARRTVGRRLVKRA